MYKFYKPCIMDVKIGQKNYDLYASAEKIQQQVCKYSLMEELGFLVVDMRVYHIWQLWDRKSALWNELGKRNSKGWHFKVFLQLVLLEKDVITASIQKIDKILRWFEDQKQLNLFCSLPVVYKVSCQATTMHFSNDALAEKRGVPKGLLSGGDIL